MTVSDRELEARLRDVEDPMNGDDIVSMDLLNGVSIDDGTATISLAFNAPSSPAEMEIGDAIRDVVEDAGLEPNLRARVGEEHGLGDDVLPMVRNVVAVAVASGKGGVGKTTVAANLAAGLRKKGARVGILDADIHGPNVPRILPADGEPGVTPDDEIVPPRSDGVMVMSMDHLTPDGDDPAILRGPMVNNVMMKFIAEVEWGRLDYLIVDLPPGTGDASLNLLQTLPVAGVVVTTPQEMAVADARKGLKLFERHDAPILGVVENMSGFRCPNCGDEHELFGTDGARGICEDYDVPLLGRLPVHPTFGTEGGDGPIVRDEGSPLRDRLLDLTETVADRIGGENRRRVAENAAPTDDAVPSGSRTGDSEAAD
ncbi:Mrp/NBP35 family ATP-binding protein [Halegenticoccus tardaugens]|uniref:Mrp/NBP35 family ATP-binding protein n=1 Tax=Halegenticoccus tardaugens TaxID=2071624 RepID=UPI00100C0396|nr:Mrp/NBP35 family ATP-binding protein [Halegenticoccus tardaugens]